MFKKKKKDGQKGTAAERITSSARKHSSWEKLGVSGARREGRSIR